MTVHVCRPSSLPCSYLLTMMSFIVPNRVEAAAKKDNAPNKRKKEKRKLNFFYKISRFLGWRVRESHYEEKKEPKNTKNKIKIQFF